MAKRMIPNCNDTQKMISALTGAQANASTLGKPWQPTSEFFYVGTFSNENEQTLALVQIDLPLAASLSVLLTRFMPGMAEEAIAAKGLSKDLCLNLREIMNIFSSKLNTEHVPHIVFQDIFLNKDLPETVITLLNQEPTERADYSVELPNYFDGKLTFLTFD